MFPPSVCNRIILAQIGLTRLGGILQNIYMKEIDCFFLGRKRHNKVWRWGLGVGAGGISNPWTSISFQIKKNCSLLTKKCQRDSKGVNVCFKGVMVFQGNVKGV